MEGSANLAIQELLNHLRSSTCSISSRVCWQTSELFNPTHLSNRLPVQCVVIPLWSSVWIILLFNSSLLEYKAFNQSQESMLAAALAFISLSYSVDFRGREKKPCRHIVVKFSSLLSAQMNDWLSLGEQLRRRWSRYRFCLTFPRVISSSSAGVGAKPNVSHT